MWKKQFLPILKEITLGLESAKKQKGLRFFRYMQQSQIKANKQHCKHCFDVLIAKLSHQPLPQWPSYLPSVPLPIFVTWKITKGQVLRGCIGTFSEQQLSKVLPEYAIVSSQNDHRFQPIKMQEVKDLSVAVSLLINFQKNKKALDWEVGKHGIIIQFEEKGIDYRATYLPEVASQQEWNQEQAVKHLIRKSGFSGDWKGVLDKISLTTYESSKDSLTYQQYQAMINK